jgi:hypothetical protein
MKLSIWPTRIEVYDEDMQMNDDVDLRDAARQALEALETVFMPHHPAVIALRAALEQPTRAQAMRDAGYTRRPTTREISALEQPEQEPVAWMYQGIKHDGTPHGPHLVWKPEHMDAMSAEKGAKAAPLYAALKERNA